MINAGKLLNAHNHYARVPEIPGLKIVDQGTLAEFPPEPGLAAGLPEILGERLRWGR